MRKECYTKLVVNNKILATIFFFLFYHIFFVSFVFAKNNADPVNSTVSVSSSSIPADGATTATISVTVKDGLKNNLSGDHITLTSTADPGLIINGGAIGADNHTAATDGDGKVNFTVSSKNPSPGTNTFTVTDTSDNPPITLGRVRIIFTAAPLAPDTSCADRAPEGAPMLKSAISKGSDQITLTWTAVADPVSYYLVAYGNESKKYIYGNPNVGGQGTTSYTVSNLANGKTYYFVVRAGNGCAPGSYSNEVSAVAGGIIIIPTPTPTKTLNSSSNSDIGKSQLVETPTPEPTETPIPTPTSQPSALTFASDFSNPKILLYILILIFVGAIVALSYWGFKKRIKKTIVKTIEENPLEKD